MSETKPEPMTSDNYVENVIRTESMDMPRILERLQNVQTVRLLHGAAGLCTEAGEFMDALKKHVWYGKELDLVNVAEEVGDALWYMGLVMDALEVPMGQVLTQNIAKLRERYPAKFTEQKALTRDLDAERKILEEE